MARSAPDEGGVNVGNPSGFIASKIREGISGNQMLREFREAGGAMERQRFLRLIGDTRDVLARQPQAAAIDPSRIPTGDELATWAMGRGGQYATQVSLSIYDRETGLVMHNPYTYVSDDPHSPEEAITEAIDIFGAQENENNYGQTVLGGVAINVYQTVPFK